MNELLFFLGAIALLDSLTLLPLAVLPMTMALGSVRPWTPALSFVAGVFTAYFLCGIPVLVGAEVLLDHFGAYLNRLWNQPNFVELGIQILIGLLLIFSAAHLWRTRNVRSCDTPRPGTSPGPMFLLGATLVVLGIPGAVPYLAGIERIVNHNPHWTASLGFLGFYNLIFVLPLLALIGLRAILGESVGHWFQTLGKFCTNAVPRITAVLFLLAGLILVADGIGWCFGRPLLPVTM